MGVSISELLILLVIAVALFGTRRLKDVGADLGSTIAGFRKAMKDHEAADANSDGAGKTLPDETVSRHLDKH